MLTILYCEVSVELAAVTDSIPVEVVEKVDDVFDDVVSGLAEVVADEKVLFIEYWEDVVVVTGENILVSALDVVSAS
jgi:hypothetical protein